MALILYNDFKDKDPNLFLGALTFAYASFIKNLVSDDSEQLKKATLCYAQGLIKNIELLSGIKIFNEE